jgi:carboxymethylenebutenolidase
MGGRLALAAACKSPQIGACVNFYGVHPNVPLDLSGLEAPVLGLFGENDGFVALEDVRKLESELQQAGKQATFHIYPGAEHAFFNDSRSDVYNEEAAGDAWNRTLDFFREHLG